MPAFLKIQYKDSDAIELINCNELINQCHDNLNLDDELLTYKAFFPDCAKNIASIEWYQPVFTITGNMEEIKHKLSYFMIDNFFIATLDSIKYAFINDSVPIFDLDSISREIKPFSYSKKYNFPNGFYISKWKIDYNYYATIEDDFITDKSAVKIIEKIENFFHCEYEDVIISIDTLDSSGHVVFNAIVNDAIVDKITLYNS